MFRHIKQSSNQLTKKPSLNNLSMRLLGLKFKSDNKIKSKAVKHILTMRWKIKTRVRS